MTPVELGHKWQVTFDIVLLLHEYMLSLGFVVVIICDRWLQGDKMSRAAPLVTPFMLLISVFWNREMG